MKNKNLFQYTDRKLKPMKNNGRSAMYERISQKTTDNVNYNFFSIKKMRKEPLW